MYYRHQITRSAELESLGPFREFIQSVCELHPEISPQTLYDIQLAVDEACTNLISHGYAGMDPGSIILALELFSQQVVVTITDFGHPFEPREPEMPHLKASLEERQEGGLGLFFIYQTMDEIFYATTEEGNRLTFIKKIHNYSVFST